MILFMKKIHEEQQQRRLLNKYPHRMSRKGYANLENEWVSAKETTCLIAYLWIPTVSQTCLYYY